MEGEGGAEPFCRCECVERCGEFLLLAISDAGDGMGWRVEWMENGGKGRVAAGLLLFGRFEF